MLRRHFTGLGLLGLTVLPLAACAHPFAPGAVGALADIEVIDRHTGAVLPVYLHGGQRYIAGEPGHRYAVALRNRAGGRLLAVVSVDGVNAVTGETAAWDQDGYVFAPGQRWEVRGWRKSQERIAAFEFTRLENSYAARTGRPDHVGVIGVALFREAMPARPAPSLSSREEQRSEAAERARGAADEAPRAQAPASPSANAQSSAEGKLAQRDSARLGTGHGASETSWVGYTRFERAQPTPDEVITIRYDSRQNLMAMGVIPWPPRPLPNPNPFPGSIGFVPDPPR